MNCSKSGGLIASLRKDKGLTQKQLADMIGISDRTVSKWERGLGCPDVSLLPELSKHLGVNIEEILSGDLGENSFVSGNLKKTKFFVCQVCGNVVLSTGNASVSCCGRKLYPLKMKKAEENEKLITEQIEDDWYITSDHPMTKENYISFAALLTGDRLQIVKQYPEWNMQTRIPKREHGILVWYCTGSGLFYQYI